MCLMEHPEIPLKLSQNTADFFGLHLVKFNNVSIPECSVEFFKYFSTFLEDNPGINSKNIAYIVNQIAKEFNEIPNINRPKNEKELENKIKKLSGWYLAKTLTEFWNADNEKSEISDDVFTKYLVCVGIEFTMTMKEIIKSYTYDVHGSIPKQYINQKLSHSKKYIRTYLCLRCGQVFFSKSNNAKYCPACAHTVRMKNQIDRRGCKNQQTHCLFCHKILPFSKTKPKKYCNDDCRYADRKKR